ncbi:cobyric acid synthase CobQ [Flavobacterium sp. HBTb2-11-1]|uniref:cobyric acid synthase CobQ n=1 Tax=Flavobacterium sp. HBTb2-11-1 TaxID=2692212 RepID=UPI00136A8F1F|nr:cobyric acid synthase CobQ [Flavobacterium sp. HBTb2-11-1]MXO04445.1 cobyric acid synthase CobQ [Flavobacterium sp. HBTb2-11-1]
MSSALKNSITYFPVCNGDQSLITLEDGTRILIDCNIRESAKEDDQLCDVHTELLESIKKDSDGIPYLDVFILTHGDHDHCRGFKKNFYTGAPGDYSKADKDKNLIRVDAMWFSPMIAEQYSNEDEDAYQQEAERRLELHRKGDLKKDLPGNRIRIIGYDGSKKYDDLDDLRSKPGEVVVSFNDRVQDKFSIFIHAPFKIHLDSPEKDKNSASIVFQARFKENSWDTVFSCQAIFGGDSDHSTWKQIIDRTTRYGNDKTEKALDWDLFMAPHHCSWTFFNDTDKDEVIETSLEALDYAKPGAFVIASSKKIVNNDDNPPYYDAKVEYIKKIESKEKFLNTAVEPKESKPEPIVFEITKNGPARAFKQKISGAATSAGGSGAASSIISQG